MQIERIQQALKRAGIDGWLFFDHHRRDPIAYRILGLGPLQPTRRWYYFVPQAGEPRKLAHKIESSVLQSLPGSTTLYSDWAEQAAQLAAILQGVKTAAMQYSPRCAIPYISLVDAGTIELVKSAGVEVVSSADLVQEFEAVWTDEQLALHRRAGRLMDQIRAEAFAFIGERLRNRVAVSEYEVQQFLHRQFANHDLITDHGPIVAVDAHAADPHYEPAAEGSALIERNQVVLIDMWAKLNVVNAVYYDITWTGYSGESIPQRVQTVFNVVRDARVAASDFVIEAVASGQLPAGFAVDDAARKVITEGQFGPNFIHRTGHSIGTEVHGNGANMDNFECHDDRRLIPNTCFSVEPGVYLTDFGIRSEVNLFVGDGYAAVTGEQQRELVRI